MFMFTGTTHTEALQILKNTPPLVELVLSRSKDGNSTLLSQALKSPAKKPNRPASSLIPRYNSEDVGKASKDVMLLKSNKSVDLSINQDENKNVTLTSRLDSPNLRTKSFGGLSTFQRQNLNASVNDFKNTTSVTNSVPAPNNIAPAKKVSFQSEEIEVEEWHTMEIALEKVEGKGLGIGVTGGANTKIIDGMTVSLFSCKDVMILVGRIAVEGRGGKNTIYYPAGLRVVTLISTVKPIHLSKKAKF